MRWTLQRRLQLIVWLTAGTLAVIVLSDAVSMRVVDQELAEIEGEYLPLLDLGPAIHNGFVGLSKSLQDAVAAQDRDAQGATGRERDALIARLETAPPIVDRRAVDQLRSAIDEWYEAAYAVSTRLIQGETGEALVHSIEDMQALQRQAQGLIDQTVVLDPQRLSAAFARARHVQLVATRLRTVIPVGLTTVVTVIALTMSRNVSRSLNELQSGFERFGRGDLDESIPVHGADELTSAALHANRMASRLKDVNRALQDRQAALERANRELEAFSYSVSHDLRAPLRSIDGFSQALLEDCSDQLPEIGKDYLRRVRAAAQRMAHLIEDILRLSRISRGEMHRNPVDISALAREVAHDVVGPESGVELAVEDGMLAEGDPQLLRIVLENLIDNARKFSSRVMQPRIEVGSEVWQGERTYFVRDNGAGFDPAYRGKLFTPFQRLHAAAEFPGTGIGLATVQRIVHRHGGRVWAEGAMGQGATFHFSLPSKGEHA